MAISSGMVKALRDKTGLPMMECKRALEEANGDEQQAIEVLRKKGLAQVNKRADRETAEGRIAFHEDAGTGRAALVEVLCETEPVTGTEDFIKLASMAAEIAAGMEAPTAEMVLAQPMPDDPSRKLEDFLHDVVNKIRENIRLGRVAGLAGNLGHYLHHDGRKGVLVEFNAECPAEVGADISMHIAAMRPACARREEVDPALVEQERQIAEEQVKGKPENIIGKIVTGKLDKWYSEIVLLEQPFVKEEKKSVGQHLRETSPTLTVNRFLRFEVGDG